MKSKGRCDNIDEHPEMRDLRIGYLRMGKDQ